MLFHLDVNSTNKQETLTGCRLATNQRAKRARWGRTATEQTTNELRSPKVDLIRLNGFESYFNFRWEKNDWHYGGVGSDVKYHSLPYWSICYDVTSRIQFRANQPGKKTVRKSRQDVSIIYNARQGFKGQGAKLCCLNWTSLRIRPS